MINLDLLRHFAQGGEASQGQPAIVGENGPELIVPQNDTTVIPNEQAGGILEWLQKNMMPAQQAPTATTAPTEQNTPALMIPQQIPGPTLSPKMQDRITAEEPPLTSDPVGLARYLEFHEKKRQTENRKLFDKSYDHDPKLIAKEWVHAHTPEGGFNYSPDIKDDVLLYHGPHHVMPGTSGRGDAALTNAAAILKGMADSKPAAGIPFNDDRTLINNEVRRRQNIRDDKRDRHNFLQDFHKLGVQNPDWGIYGGGGVAPAGQPAIVGDQGPELIVPKSDVTVIPNDVLSNPQMADAGQSLLHGMQNLGPGAIPSGITNTTEEQKAHLTWAQAMIGALTGRMQGDQAEFERARLHDYHRSELDKIRMMPDDRMAPSRIPIGTARELYQGMYSREKGGPIPAGQPAMVGEAGPELIVPQKPLNGDLSSLVTQSDAFQKYIGPYLKHVGKEILDFNKLPLDHFLTGYHGRKDQNWLTEEDVMNSDAANQRAAEWGPAKALSMVIAPPFLGTPGRVGTLGSGAMMPRKSGVAAAEADALNAPANKSELTLRHQPELARNDEHFPFGIYEKSGTKRGYVDSSEQVPQTPGDVYIHFWKRFGGKRFTSSDMAELSDQLKKFYESETGRAFGSVSGSRGGGLAQFPLPYKKD